MFHETMAGIVRNMRRFLPAPSTPRLLDLAFLLVFLFALQWLGARAARRVHTPLDYHLAGRRLGRLPAAMSLAATEFNGSGLVGGAGLAYSIGVAGSFWNLSAVPAWLLLGPTVAYAFHRKCLTTPAELLGERYGMGARRLAAATQVLSGVLFTSVQVLVSALALEALLGWPRPIAALVVTLAFLGFTFAGGLLAVVWADMACYVVLMTAVVVAAPLALHLAGGMDGLRATLPPAAFDWGRLGTAEPLAWMALCFYSYATDHAYLQRVFAAGRAETARFAYVFTGANYLVFGGAVALLGMAAAVLLPGLDPADRAIPELITRIFPPGVRSFFLTGLIAATLSTASSYLAAGSALFTSDLYPTWRERTRGAPAGERELMRVSRGVTVVLALGAFACAMLVPRVVDAVVLSVLVSHAAIFVPLLAALYLERVPARAGTWAILLGAAGGLVAHFFAYGRWPVVGMIHPLFVGPILASAALLAGRSWRTVGRRPDASAGSAGSVQ